MAVRFWVGLWTALIIFIVVATDASALLAYVTRFRLGLPDCVHLTNLSTTG
jgi:hypothetical protein